MGKDQEFLDAARNGNISFIEKVLNQKIKRSGPLASLRCGPGVSVQDSSGYSALHHACLNGHGDIVRLLLAYEASPNLPDTRGSSPLHLAAWAGHPEIVKMLLIHPYRPANPNMLTIENETPLHCAAQHGHIGALSALLAHDADPNVRNNRNETPLDLAAQYGRLQAVQMLIRAHPELIVPHYYENSTQNLPAHTCLHLASRNGHKHIVDVLLAAGVNVNLRTPAGSALHEAALCGKETVVLTLLRAGIDLNATDAEGRTAIDILKEFPPNVTKGIISVIKNFRDHIDADAGIQINARNKDLQHKRKQARNGDTHQAQSHKHSNHNFNFNSNNHLLNHSHAHTHGMQQSVQHYNNRISKKSENNNKYCGKFLDQELPNTRGAAVDELKCFLSSSNLESPVHNSRNLQNDMAISPSSSLSSFEPNSVSPRSRSSTGGMGGISSGGTIFTPASAGPPTKPPRRNLSVSPTHNAAQHQSCYNSIKQHQLNERQCCSETQEQDFPRGKCQYASAREMHATYENNCLPRSGSASGNVLTTSSSNDRHNQCQRYDDDEIEMPPNCNTFTATKPQIFLTPRAVSLASDLVNPILKSYNPNRKLKRNRDSCSDTNSSETQPQSPTNYMQPPTPEHPPPSVNQAERMIYERIRPLSQEYKLRSVLGLLQQQNLMMIERATSPPNVKEPPTSKKLSSNASAHALVQSARLRLCGSSGSLSSSISFSDCSVSTDCVEEYIGDVPFAGLLKGSATTPQQNEKQLENHNNKCQQQQAQASPTTSAGHTPKSYNSNNSNKPLAEARQQRIKNFLERRNESVSQQDAVSKSPTQNHTTESNILSPFKEEEAWERISEIIESFGSGILNDDPHIDAYNSNSLLLDFDYDFDDTEMPVERHELANRLRQVGLLHLERTLFENGYDNYSFMNGVIEERDFQLMNISAPDVTKLLKLVETLPNAIFQPHQQQSLKKQLDSENSALSKQNGVSTLSSWLSSIELSAYTEVFNKHLYNTIESVCGVWDVELQTVLEINKLGHRRRILRSLAYMQNPVQTETKTPLSDNDERNRTADDLKDNEKEHKRQQISEQPRKQANRGVRLTRKNRHAPPPPTTANNTISDKAVEGLDIRAPSELLLGLPTDLRTKWRHSAQVLVNEQLKYEVKYLGSTIVKELRGTESTRKSILKLKRDELTTATTLSSSLKKQQHHSLPKYYAPTAKVTASTEHTPSLVCLVISQCGVEFMDVNSKHSICYHEIHNINCACQDATDLSYFAYITKEQDLHYCHVFNADSTDLATEIILTLGQAFEVAYQMALRSGNTSKSVAEKQ